MNKLDPIVAALVIIVVCCAVQANAGLPEQVCRAVPVAGIPACINCCAWFGMYQKPCRIAGNCVCTTDVQYQSAASDKAIEANDMVPPAKQQQQTGQQGQQRQQQQTV